MQPPQVLNVLKLNGRFGLAEGDHCASDRILKFDDNPERHLLLNESLSLIFATALGHPVARAQLIRIGDFRALEILRFDRKAAAGDPMRILRRHVIDACQALGVPPKFKYERLYGSGRDVAHIRDGVSLTKIFGLSRFMSSPQHYLENAADWVILNLIIGNCDAHGKNFSFFGGRSGFEATPWYDLIAVELVPGVEHELAMAVDDVFESRDVHALQLLYAAQNASIPFDFKKFSRKIFSILLRERNNRC